jgi:hypothetical protein
VTANRYSCLDDYALQHLPHHLRAGKKTSDLFALMNDDFCSVLRARTKSDVQFAEHLKLATAAAVDRRELGTADLVRLLCIDQGLTARADAVWPTTLMLMARVADAGLAIDLAALPRSWPLKPVSLILILRAIIERDDARNRSHVEQASKVASSELSGQVGTVLATVLARAFSWSEQKPIALQLLRSARTIATREIEPSQQPMFLACVADALLEMGSYDEVIQTANCDRLRANAIPILDRLLDKVIHAGDLETGQTVVELAGAIPDWVSARHGLDPDSLFSIARHASQIGRPECGRELRKKAETVANDLGVRGLVAIAVDRWHMGDVSGAKRVFREASEKAAGETFFAQAWLDLAVGADRVGDVRLRDESLQRAAEAMSKEPLYRGAEVLTAVARMHESAGDRAEAARIIDRVLRPLEEVDSYELDNWVSLAILRAELSPTSTVPLLKDLQTSLASKGFPILKQAELGMALARHGDLKAANLLLEEMQSSSGPLETEPGKSLVMARLVGIAKSEGDTLRAETWGAQLRTGRRAWRDDIRSLDHIALLLLSDDGTTRNPSQEWDWSCLQQLLPTPTELDIDPHGVLDNIIQAQRGAGGSVEIGHTGRDQAEAIWACCGSFLSRNDVESALDAVGHIEFWRMQEYIQMAPMDSSDFGTHEFLFKSARYHAGSVQSIIEAISGQPDSVVSGIVKEIVRNPFESLRFAMRVGLLRMLQEWPGDRFSLVVRALYDCVFEGRQELLGAIAAWLPQLHRMAGTALLDKLNDVNALLGTAVGKPEIPNIFPGRLRGASYRTFNLR